MVVSLQTQGKISNSSPCPGIWNLLDIKEMRSFVWNLWRWKIGKKCKDWEKLLNVSPLTWAVCGGAGKCFCLQFWDCVWAAKLLPGLCANLTDLQPSDSHWLKKNLLCFMKCWSILSLYVCCGVLPSQHEREREQDAPDNAVLTNEKFSQACAGFSVPVLWLSAEQE